MVFVKIIASKAELNFEGDWDKDENPDNILDDLKKEAEDNGIPLMVTIKHHGTFSISPRGQILRGSLYDDDKLKKVRKSSNR